MTESAGGGEGRIAKALEAARDGALYGASIPERTLRAMVGAASGVLRESAKAAVPDAMKGSKLYELTVRKMLRFLVEDVGGLEGLGSEPGSNEPASAASREPPAASLSGPGTATTAPPGGTDYVMKKAIGNAVDIAGLAALHVSPMWVIAILSDVVLGARTYLNALGEELRRTGVIAPDTKFEGVDGLLAAIQQVSGTVADGLDTPPVTNLELKGMVDRLRKESSKVDLRSIVKEADLQAVWDGIVEAARVEGRSPFEVSNALAVMAYGQLARLSRGAYGTVKVSFDLLNDNVLVYYGDGLRQIAAKGYYQALLDATGPYLEGLRHLFEPSRESWTEKLLRGKPLRALLGRIACWWRARRERRRKRRG